MTITVDVSSKEFQDLKGYDGNPPRNFIIVKQNENNTLDDTVIVQEVDEKGAHTNNELHFIVTYIIADHIGMRKDYRTLGLKLKA